MDDALEAITMEDLYDDQRELAEVIGLQSFKELIYTYGGSQIYIPKMDQLKKVKRNQSICAEFNGYNFKELAYKYNLTVSIIRDIVKDIAKEKRRSPCDGQLSISDFL